MRYHVFYAWILEHCPSIVRQVKINCYWHHQVVERVARPPIELFLTGNKQIFVINIENHDILGQILQGFFKLYILVGWPNSHSQKRQKSWKLSSTKLICSTSGFQMLSLWSPLVLLMRNLAKVNLRMNIEYWGLLKVLKLGEYLELRPGSCDTSLMELHRESNSSSFAISESTTQLFFVLTLFQKNQTENDSIWQSSHNFTLLWC